MLTKFRNKLKPIYEPLARIIAKHLRNPNIVTLIGLVISFGVPLSAAMGLVSLSLSLLIISAYMDVLDGAIARISGRVSRFGAVLDSFSDRVTEFNYLFALAILGLSPYLAMVMLTLSFLISYLRSKGELQGIRMEGVGILERSERILIVMSMFAVFMLRKSVFSITIARSIITIIAIVFISLCIITIAQRLYHIYRCSQN